MATANQWLKATRPNTLPASVAPVIIGTGVAVSLRGFEPVVATLCLLVALLLQIGCNFSNDYSDGIKGTDKNRKGPQRLVGSGSASPQQVLLAAILVYALAATVGLTLALYTHNYWLIAVGALCLLAAWFYTGGKKAYGYNGLGEISVFIFFGLIATGFTVYLQTGTYNIVTISSAVAMGMLASAMLLINNIRDIPTDLENGKKTLATKLGDGKSRAIYCLFITVPIVISGLTIIYAPLSIISLVSIYWVIKCLKPTLNNAQGFELIVVLKSTGQLQIVYAVTMAIAYCSNIALGI